MKRFEFFTISVVLASCAYLIYDKRSLFQSLNDSKKSDRLAWPQILPAPLLPFSATNAYEDSSYSKNGNSLFRSTPAPAERWNKAFLPKRIDAYQFVGQSIGSMEGYSAVGTLLAPFYPPYKLMPFVQIQAVHFNQGTYGGNFGVGARYIPSTLGSVVGVNTFYDYQEGEHGPFHRVGFGVEAIGNRFGLSANGYVPVAKKKRVKTCVYDNYIGGYKAVNHQADRTYTGFNLEGTWIVLQRGDFWVYASGGPYVFTEGWGTSPFLGGQFTFEPNYGDFISLSFTISHDPVFGTLYGGGISLSLPLYAFSRLKDYKSPSGVSSRQIYQPVNRMGNAPSKRKCCWKSNF